MELETRVCSNKKPGTNIAPGFSLEPVENQFFGMSFGCSAGFAAGALLPGGIGLLTGVAGFAVSLAAAAAGLTAGVAPPSFGIGALCVAAGGVLPSAFVCATATVTASEADRIRASAFILLWVLFSNVNVDILF